MLYLEKQLDLTGSDPGIDCDFIDNDDDYSPSKSNDGHITEEWQDFYGELILKD